MTLDPISIVVEAPSEFRRLNDLESAAAVPESAASDLRWVQAEEVVMLLATGKSLREVAANWRSARTGEAYSHMHVQYTAKTWHAFVNLSLQDRPPWNEAYNSDEVRGGEEAEKDEHPDEWFTPRWLFDGLGITFSIDVCAPENREHVATPAEAFYVKTDDGLTAPWHGTVWCNPPYSKTEPWATRMIAHSDGLMLSHVPINAEWCTRVWATCGGIRLFQAMEFVRPDGMLQRPGYWLMLAAFGDTATTALAALTVPDDVAVNPRRVPSPMWRS